MAAVKTSPRGVDEVRRHGTRAEPEPGVQHDRAPQLPRIELGANIAGPARGDRRWFVGRAGRSWQPPGTARGCRHVACGGPGLATHCQSCRPRWWSVRMRRPGRSRRRHRPGMRQLPRPAGRAWSPLVYRRAPTSSASPCCSLQSPDMTPWEGRCFKFRRTGLSGSGAAKGGTVPAAMSFGRRTGYTLHEPASQAGGPNADHSSNAVVRRPG